MRIKDKAITITADQMQATDDYLMNLPATDSPGLQQAIADKRARLGDWTITSA